MAHFERTCREAGIRLTPQRLEIFREVARTGDHPDAETVFVRVREHLPSVSLDTVYRTLWLLNEHGLITTLGPSRARTRFDANLERHHHFICIRCGLTRDFHCDLMDGLEPPSAARSFGRVETMMIEARGVCRACTAKAERRA